MLIKEILKSKRPIFSFEVFPAKTEEKYQELLNILKSLCDLEPDFISCTYGAAGGSRDRTFEIVEHIQKKNGVTSMAHLTCISHTRDEIANIFDDLKGRGIDNILALYGDPPMEGGAELEIKSDFRYSADLVAFIRERFGNTVSIGVSGFPDKHPTAPSFEDDAEYLKSKVSAGADFAITQLFFDNKRYFEYVERLKGIGVNIPIIPGILPITNYESLIRFCDKCGATVTDQVHELFAPIKEDPDKTRQQGIDFCINQCRELLKGGAPGIHFYALNKISPVNQILETVRSFSS